MAVGLDAAVQAQALHPRHTEVPLGERLFVSCSDVLLAASLEAECQVTRDEATITGDDN